MTVSYRAEVDGLRAIAVLPVLLFHAGFPQFAGGFVGVDVFFVISGYLITSIILADVENGRFSFAEFYERRARRILPALYLVLVASLCAAWLIMLPDDLREFGQVLVAVVGFVSNFQLLRESGYFQISAELNPLLHTWSLAVEEQYYLLFPPLLLLMVAWGRRRLALLLATVAVCSLVLPELRDFEESHAKFFLLPTRAWELMIGSLLALLPPRLVRELRRAPAAGLGAALGLLMIGLAIVGFDRHTPFPGPTALVPTIGAALVITFAHSDNLIGRLLAFKPVVFVGLLSYSLYLWHQPLLAFVRYQTFRQPAVEWTWLILGISAVLAFLSWKYVEIPFRDRRRFTRHTIFAMSVVGAMLLGTVGAFLHFSGGDRVAFESALDARQFALWRSWQQPVAEDSCRFAVAAFDKSAERRFRDCAARHGKALLFAGDSHAGDVFASFIANSPQKFVVCYCTPTFRPHKWRDSSSAHAFADFVDRHAANLQSVYYSTAGFHLVRNEHGAKVDPESLRARVVSSFQPDEQAIERVIVFLDGLGEKTSVTWLGPRLEPHLNVAKIMRSALDCDLAELTLVGEIEHGYRRLDQHLANRAFPRRFRYHSMVHSVGLDPGEDVYTCSAVFWSDGHHWSSDGERRFGERLVASLPR